MNRKNRKDSKPGLGMNITQKQDQPGGPAQSGDMGSGKESVEAGHEAEATEVLTPPSVA
jgi:hypothetical protein